MTGEKRPTDHLEPAAKKRGSERQITKDDADQDEEVCLMSKCMRETCFDRPFFLASFGNAILHF